MGLKYSEMNDEQKKKHYENTEKYRKKHPDISRKCSLEYYYANKEKAAEKAKKWRDDNLEYRREYQKQYKRERKLKAISYLGGKCQACSGEFHPAVYEFHHIDPSTKDRDPSKMLSLSWERLTSELDKCKLLCANCHRIEHHKNNYE